MSDELGTSLLLVRVDSNGNDLAKIQVRMKTKLSWITVVSNLCYTDFEEFGRKVADSAKLAYEYWIKENDDLLTRLEGDNPEGIGALTEDEKKKLLEQFDSPKKPEETH